MAGMTGMTEPLQARALLPGATPMLVTHLSAALGVAGWLRLAERHAFAAARRWAEFTESALLQPIRLVLGRRILIPAAVVRLTAVQRSEPSAPRVGRRIARAVERRGPPLFRTA